MLARISSPAHSARVHSCLISCLMQDPVPPPAYYIQAQCFPGFACPNGSTMTACPAGTWCPGGTPRPLGKGRKGMRPIAMSRPPSRPLLDRLCARCTLSPQTATHCLSAASVLRFKSTSSCPSVSLLSALNALLIPLPGATSCPCIHCTA
jgi:hypothetical protein